MEGAYLAHSVYGFFQNGGSLCWVVRVGDDGGNSAAPRAALPAAADATVEAFRVVALRVRQRRRQGRAHRGALRGREGRRQDLQARRLLRAARSEEHEGLTLKKGRANLATKVNAASKLIKVEETGASLPEAQRIPATGSYTLSKPSIQPDKVKPTHFEGDVAAPPGHGRPRGGGRDHDGRDAGPHGRSATTSRSATCRAR